jgi:D-aminopeptidase
MVREQARRRPRAREAGVALGGMTPGPHNAITDVGGVRVGHATIVRGAGPLVPGRGPVRTGVTAVVPHDGDLFAAKVPAAAAVFNGFGKTIGLMQIAELGQLETPILLTNTLNVGKVADALVGYAVERHAATGGAISSVNPVVAECNDGYLNDIQGRHVGERQVRAALGGARGGPVGEGNTGAGAGMMAYGFAGGIGTASRRLGDERGGYTVGALVLANFGRRRDLTIGGAPVGRELPASGGQANDASPRPPAPGIEREQGSVIVILATDAPLDARQLGRLARRTAFGLARTGTYCGHASGDLAIAFTTADRIPHGAGEPLRAVTVLAEDAAALNELFAAVVESVEEAVVNALFAARPVQGRDGHRAEALPLEETVQIIQRHRLAAADIR